MHHHFDAPPFLLLYNVANQCNASHGKRCKEQQMFTEQHEKHPWDIRETPLRLKFGEHQSKLLTAQNHTRTI